MFSFKLTESSELARSIIAREAERELTYWDRVDAAWREAKAGLIAALDPATARKSIEVSYDPCAEQIAKQWRSALSFKAEKLATEKFCEAQRRLTTAQTLAQKETAQKTLDKRGGALALMHKVKVYLREFSGSVSSARPEEYRR